MSKLTIEDIKKLSDLAKIEITTEEEEIYLKDINNILEHLSLVGEAKIHNTDNSFYFDNIVRTDNFESKDFDRDILLGNIPDKSDDNFVKAPKVLKK